jgi:hypothetical protein
MAERFGVEPSTISCWERGIADPGPKTLTTLRDIAAGQASNPGKHLLAASPVFKYLAPMDDLRTPVLVSQGVLDTLLAVGAISSFEEFLTDPSEIRKIWVKPDDPDYGHSFSKAVALVEGEPRWLRGEIAFVEIHAYAKPAQRWGRGLIAPIPEENLALFEGVGDPVAGGEKFWVSFTAVSEEGGREGTR